MAVLKDLFSSIDAHITPLFEKVDGFRMSVGDDSLLPTTISSLKSDILQRALDMYVKNLISKVNVVNALIHIAHLCRYTKHILMGMSEERLASKEYMMYNAAIEYLPKHICVILEGLSGDHFLPSATDTNGNRGVDYCGETYNYVITPYSICSSYGDPIVSPSLERYERIYEDVKNAGYPQEVTMYALEQVKAILL
jgi:hypothetical protein